jgi:hypothetical protein
MLCDHLGSGALKPSKSMSHDLSGAILAHISNFAVGLVVREDRGSRVLGSGVLVTIEGRRGILTCGHVAECYEKLAEIGLIRFVPGGHQQRRILKLADTLTLILQSSATFVEGKEVLDLAFTALPPESASSIEAQSGVFLNIEKNRAKMEAHANNRAGSIDAMLGLIAEFSGAAFAQGREFISPMRGVLHTGHVCAQQNGLLTMRAMDYNLNELPKSFGGMSGGGLWRVYFQEGVQESMVVDMMLCGIASWQIDDRHIACQGWDRIDQALVRTVREKIPT